MYIVAVAVAVLCPSVEVTITVEPPFNEVYVMYDV